MAQQLEKDYVAKQYQKMQEPLEQLRLTPTVQSLELACLHAVQTADLPRFQTSFLQLLPMYSTHKSARMNQLIGLELLYLLATHQLAAFHVLLEQVDLDNIYIKHVLEIESFLMEGSYNQVYSTRNNVPCAEYAVFMEMLLATIRLDIAACIQSAYTRIPLVSLAPLVFLPQQDVAGFVKQRGWHVENGNIVLGGTKTLSSDLGADVLVATNLGYAMELEQIV